MGDVRFRCPRCSAKLAVDKAAVLYPADCPRCGARISPWGAEMLDVRFRCEACNGRLVVDKKRAGQTVTCPHCDRPTTVPETRSAATGTNPTELTDDEVIVLTSVVNSRGPSNKGQARGPKHRTGGR